MVSKAKNMNEDIPINEPSKFKCRKLEKEFNYWNQLKLHTSKYHEIRIQCEFCEEVFADNSKYESH